MKTAVLMERELFGRIVKQNSKTEFIKDFENDKSGVSKPKYTYLVAAIPDKFR